MAAAAPAAPERNTPAVPVPAAAPAPAPVPAPAFSRVRDVAPPVAPISPALAAPELLAQVPMVATPPAPAAPEAPRASAPAPAPVAKPAAQPAVERKVEPGATKDKAVELQPWSPTPAPKLDFLNLDGTPFKAAELRGKRVLLNFWAVWCLPCREEIPALQKFADAQKARGVEVILVNLGDSREAIERFLQRVPTRLRIVRLRGDAPRAGDWNVTGLPATFLLDGNGTPRWRALGRVDGKASEALIERRLQELPPGR